MEKDDIARAWALSRVGNPYIMGATGQFCTISYREARCSQYPGSAESIRANCPRMAGKQTSCAGCRWYDDSAKTGKRAYDCAQLTRWAMDSVGIKLVSGATSQWNKTPYTERGKIAKMPQDRLCLVYRQDNASTMGHTGIYLGDGTVVHAKGHASGVVREDLPKTSFTHYLIPQGLYEESEEKAMQYKVIGGALRMREGPGTEYDVILSIPDGSTVDFIEDAGLFYRVQYAGETGYCMKAYLQPYTGDLQEDEQEYISIPKSALEALKTAFNAIQEAIK